VIVEDITSRKKAEHAIREDQQKFERLFVKIPEAAICWDSNYRVLDINPRFTELFGYTLDEIQGKDSTSFLVPESSLDESDSLGRKARLGSVHKDGVRKRKDGSLVPVSISVAPLIFDGQLTGLVGLYKDMTERKRIEDALRDSEEKYRSLVENSKDSIVIIDLNGNVLFHNKATEELTGYTTGHEVPSNVREITPLRYWPKSLAMLLKARQGKPTPYFESVIRRKDGKLVAVESGGQAIFKNGRITGIQIITRDISERKRSNKALRQSKERFRNLFENALDVILATDLQGNVTSINKAIERFGWKADDIVGRSMFEFMSEETWPSLLRGLDQIIEGKPLEGEMELLTPTGRRTAEFRSSAIVQDGKTVGIQVIGRDVTERKKMEEKLKRYSHHLEEMVEERTQQLRNAEEQLVKTTRLATIGELAAMVAHDLRNPLASIRNASYFVKSGCRYRKDPKCKTNREMLNLIEQETVFANSIINSLLDFAARKPLRCRRQSISNLVESAVRKSDIAKSIRVERNLPEKMAINGDGKQLKRAFLNLIENAAQAMPNGGRLAITATETEENVAIDFADTGTGIPDENMDRIFSPLFTTKAKGIGMGLPICKRVTEEHGGTISVKSKVGQGTTFTITLPRNRGGRDE
jgi:PAS domain S-box-containing protein